MLLLERRWRRRHQPGSLKIASPDRLRQFGSGPSKVRQTQEAEEAMRQTPTLLDVGLRGPGSPYVRPGPARPGSTRSDPAPQWVSTARPSPLVRNLVDGVWTCVSPGAPKNRHKNRQNRWKKKKWSLVRSFVRPGKLRDRLSRSFIFISKISVMFMKY